MWPLIQIVKAEPPTCWKPHRRRSAVVKNWKKSKRRKASSMRTSMSSCISISDFERLTSTFKMKFRGTAKMRSCWTTCMSKESLTTLDNQWCPCCREVQISFIALKLSQSQVLMSDLDCEVNGSDLNIKVLSLKFTALIKSATWLILLSSHVEIPTTSSWEINLVNPSSRLASDHHRWCCCDIKSYWVKFGWILHLNALIENEVLPASSISKMKTSLLWAQNPFEINLNFGNCWNCNPVCQNSAKLHSSFKRKKNWVPVSLNSGLSISHHPLTSRSWEAAQLFSLKFYIRPPLTDPAIVNGWWDIERTEFSETGFQFRRASQNWFVVSPIHKKLDSSFAEFWSQKIFKLEIQK